MNIKTLVNALFYPIPTIVTIVTPIGDVTAECIESDKLSDDINNLILRKWQVIKQPDGQPNDLVLMITVAMEDN